MTYRRPWYLKSVLLLAPSAAVAVFALAAIALPVGANGLGGAARDGLAGWARDIHDGFWRGAPALLSTVGVSDSPHRQAQSLCRLGQAEEAVTLYEKIGVRGEADEDALFGLLDRLVVEGDWTRCEWFAPRGDALMHTGALRNNLAWHYTQANLRPEKALDLALASVAEERRGYNVDTLAWAYYRDGQRGLAANIAREAIALCDGRHDWESAHSAASSRKLLSVLSEPATVDRDPFVKH